MAHFAELDENNIVKRVVVVSNDDCGGGDFPESDPIGAALLSEKYGGTWKQTSYNNNFRGRYAGKDMEYDPELDVFCGFQIYPSWVKDSTGQWNPPIPKPEGNYFWDESEYDADEGDPKTQGWVYEGDAGSD